MQMRTAACTAIVCELYCNCPRRLTSCAQHCAELECVRCVTKSMIYGTSCAQSVDVRRNSCSTVSRLPPSFRLSSSSIQGTYRTVRQTFRPGTRVHTTTHRGLTLHSS